MDSTLFDPRQVLIVDDDTGYRASLSALLGRAGYRTIEASTGEEALALVRRARPDCVLLDVHLPGATGYEICRELRDAYGELLPIVFVTGERVEAADRVAGLLVGADDYLVKPVEADELIARLRRYFARSSAHARGSVYAGRLGLTRREGEVLKLLAHGSAQVAIAQELMISPTTVATHIQRILAKLGVHSRAQAVALAYREGLVEAHADAK